MLRSRSVKSHLLGAALAEGAAAGTWTTGDTTSTHVLGTACG